MTCAQRAGSHHASCRLSTRRSVAWAGPRRRRKPVSRSSGLHCCRGRRTQTALACPLCSRECANSEPAHRRLWKCSGARSRIVAPAPCQRTRLACQHWADFDGRCRLAWRLDDGADVAGTSLDISRFCGPEKCRQSNFFRTAIFISLHLLVVFTFWPNGSELGKLRFRRREERASSPPHDRPCSLSHYSWEEEISAAFAFCVGFLASWSARAVA